MLQQAVLQARRTKMGQKAERKIKKRFKVRDPHPVLIILIEMELNGIIRSNEKSHAISKTTMIL